MMTCLATKWRVMLKVSEEEHELGEASLPLAPSSTPFKAPFSGRMASCRGLTADLSLQYQHHSCSISAL